MRAYRELPFYIKRYIYDESNRNTNVISSDSEKESRAECTQFICGDSCASDDDNNSGGSSTSSSGEDSVINNDANYSNSSLQEIDLVQPDMDTIIDNIEVQIRPIFKYPVHKLPPIEIAESSPTNVDNARQNCNFRDYLQDFSISDDFFDTLEKSLDRQESLLDRALLLSVNDKSSESINVVQNLEVSNQSANVSRTDSLSDNGQNITGTNQVETTPNNDIGVEESTVPHHEVEGSRQETAS